MAPDTARTLSLADTIRFNLLFVLPYATRGIFTRRRFWVGLWARLHPDPLGVRLIADLRRSYGSPYLRVRLLTTPALLVLDLDAVRRILDHSPAIYADPPAKRRGMAHFQPHAVTISRGEEWRDRRRFNDAVVGSAGGTHPLADRVLAIVRREVDLARRRPGHRLVWADVQALFEAITLQVVFGQGARHDRPLLAHLHAMLEESNQPAVSGTSRHFAPFYARVRRYLAHPEPDSLAALVARTPATATTRAENQIPHWLFAMNETLATNVAQALALIAAHPPVAARARAEIAGQDVTTVAGIQRLTTLAGCLHEAMRLWPTTPLLVREALAEDRLGGAIVRAGDQVVIHNGFNHRDREAYPLADTFAPEAWPAARDDYRFNHLSHGPQICAGFDLTVFIGTAVLATLLVQDHYTLVGPEIDPHRPLPHALDYFALRLARVPLAP